MDIPRKSIYDGVVGVLRANYVGQFVNVDNSTSLRLDSEESLSLAGDLETKFGIVFPDDVAFDMGHVSGQYDRVGQIVSYIHRNWSSLRKANSLSLKNTVSTAGPTPRTQCRCFRPVPRMVTPRLRPVATPASLAS